MERQKSYKCTPVSIRSGDLMSKYAACSQVSLLVVFQSFFNLRMFFQKFYMLLCHRKTALCYSKLALVMKCNVAQSTCSNEIIKRINLSSLVSPHHPEPSDSKGEEMSFLSLSWYFFLPSTHFLGMYIPCITEDIKWIG